MAERNTALTPAREDRLARARSRELGGSPFSALQRFADEVDRMFGDIGFGGWGRSPLLRETSTEVWSPDVEVFQRNNELTIRADLPGLKRDEVSVEVTDSAVTIHGERKREHHEEREGVYRSERTYGSFHRVVSLPEGAITEEAKATFKDGVLEVTLPAPPASKGRRLEITEESRK